MNQQVLQDPAQAETHQFASNTQSTLFPLRLTPFEYYFLIEDRPDYPGIIPITFEARGQLDRKALERAYVLTHLRHPMLSACTCDDAKNWPNWVAGEPEPIEYEGPEYVRDRSPAAPPTGVRLRVKSRPAISTFLFEFRHVAVDGLGDFQFISDLLVAYAHLSLRETGPIWRRLEPERLKNRDGHQLFNRKLKPVDFLRMAKVHLPLSLREAALVSDEKGGLACDQLVPSLPSDFLVEHLTQEETAALSRVAAKQSVMLNDLLVRDYFLTLAEWNRGTSQERRPLRILIPTNMRGREDLAHACR